jgi:hypothetical protein
MNFADLLSVKVAIDDGLVRITLNVATRSTKRSAVR